MALCGESSGRRTRGFTGFINEPPLPMLTHTWFWRATDMRPVDRKGEPCRVLARGKMNNILVEFADGYRVVVSRYAVRKREGILG